MAQFFTGQIPILRFRRAQSQVYGIRRAREEPPNTGHTFNEVGKQSGNSW
jgi:hypothetical protein